MKTPAKICALALALAALLPLAAEATTYTVSDSASARTAQLNARFGDLIQYVRGPLSATLFMPDSGGHPGAYLRIVGRPSAPDSCLITGGTTFNKPFVSVNGFRFRGGDINFTSSYADSMVNCVSDSGGLWMAGNGAAGDTGLVSGQHVLQDVRFNQGNTGNHFAWYLADMKECQFTRVKMTAVRSDAGDNARGRYFFYSRRNRLTDCRFEVDYTGTSDASGEHFSDDMRDLSDYNVFTRDTVWIGLRLKHGRQADLSQSGNVGRGTTGNQFYNCDYRNYDHTFVAEDSLGFDQWIFDHCVFASHTAVPMQIAGLATDRRAVTIRYCTFFSDSPFALNWRVDPDPARALLHGNIFVCRPSSVRTYHAVDDGGCLYSTTGTFFNSDSNYFACSVPWKTAGDLNWPYRYLASSYNGAPSWQVATGNDVHSRSSVFSGGMFVDARWSSLDLHPSPCSVLTNAAAPGGHWGALAGNPCH